MRYLFQLVQHEHQVSLRFDSSSCQNLAPVPNDNHLHNVIQLSYNGKSKSIHRSQKIRRSTSPCTPDGWLCYCLSSAYSAVRRGSCLHKRCARPFLAAQLVSADILAVTSTSPPWPTITERHGNI